MENELERNLVPQQKATVPQASDQYEAIVNRAKNESGMNNAQAASSSFYRGDGSPAASLYASGDYPRAPGNYSGAAGGNYSQPSAGYNSTSYADQINDIYDKALAAERAQLDSGYNSSMRELEAAAEKIPGLYQARSNDLASQYERNRANLNEQLAANGMNVGAGSQARLAQNVGYQSAYGQIQAAQADAQAAIEQQKAAREAEYQAAITAALKENDYQRAVALMNEMKNQQSMDLDRAKLLAGYGDFSGYASLYGQDTADNMRAVWMAQNPAYAYMTGNLSAEDYYKLTGQYPAGYKSPSTGYTYTPPTQPPEEEPDRELPTYGDTGQTEYDARRVGDAITRIAKAGNQQEALEAWNVMSDTVWDSMTADQQQQVLDQLKKYGIG